MKKLFSFSCLFSLAMLESTFLQHGEIICNNKFQKNSTEEDVVFCRKYWGNDLKSCMQHCNKKEFVRNLLSLDGVSGQRKYFFKEYLKSSAEYKELADKYETEEEWQKLWLTLSQDEIELFFKSLSTTLTASSKANLIAFIKEKESDENFSRNVRIGAVVVGGVVVGCVVICYGPVVLAYLSQVATSNATTTIAGAAAL